MPIVLYARITETRLLEDVTRVQNLRYSAVNPIEHIAEVDEAT